ncbi:Mov34/MPN/PAD-1 family protein [Deinococcus metallilatus]|uniref:Mov34/MPN/PAD-1 family protein n=1 Tax=Deinococcus metallilatus TaxID=1211322 RepID=UPI00267F8E1C
MLRARRERTPARDNGRVALILPPVLVDALWAHAERDAPRECVGALGGHLDGEGAEAVALYPLANVSPDPERTYLADPGHLLRALRAMQAGGLTLVALYHSHPRGPAYPSPTDTRLAVYPVPYVIADLGSRTLRAYRLPEGTPVVLRVEGRAD